MERWNNHQPGLRRAVEFHGMFGWNGWQGSFQVPCYSNNWGKLIRFECVALGKSCQEKLRQMALSGMSCVTRAQDGRLHAWHELWHEGARRATASWHGPNWLRKVLLNDQFCVLSQKLQWKLAFNLVLILPSTVAYIAIDF